MRIPLPRRYREPRLYPRIAILWTMYGNWRSALKYATTEYAYGRKVHHYHMRGRFSLTDLYWPKYHFRLGKVVDPG